MFLPSTNLRRMIERLMKEYTVVAPVRVEKNAIPARISPSDLEKVDLGVKSPFPFKYLIYPPRQRMLTYRGDDIEVPSIDERTVAIGLRGCDVRALELLDMVFLDEPEDFYYRQARDRTLIISVDCTTPFENCFCTSVGIKPYPERGYDINLVPIEGGYAVEAGERYEKILGKIRDLIEDRDVEDDVRESREKMMKLMENLPPMEDEIYRNASVKKDEDFRDYASRCVECGGCVYVCPTCFCFYVTDDVRGRERLWDTCMYEGFQKVAAGINPRATLTSRLRNRMLHKLAYFREIHGVHGCVGCGRCVEVCLGRIDIREVAGIHAKPVPST